MDKTCKDCIHYDVCQYHITEETTMTVNECSHSFKDKSRYIELPCAVGDTIWYELYGKIESAVVYSCIGVFKKYGVEITDANAKSSDGLEVAFNGKCIGKTVFLTKDEAEQALKGDDNNA